MAIPLAIVVGGLLIASAATALHAWLNRERKEQEKKAAAAVDVTAEAIRLNAYGIRSMPGLEAETSRLTSHIGQFEQIVDPSVDLIYAKKLTGQAPSTAPPGFDKPTVTTRMDNEARALELINQGIIPSELRNLLRSGVDPESAAAELSGQGTAGYLAISLAHTPGIIAEAASLGQIESVSFAIQDLLKASGIPDIVKASNMLPYEVAVLLPARSHYNRVYRPMHPAAKDLPAMLARRQITEVEYIDQVAFQGFDGRWATALWNTFLRLPGPRELAPMRWRGLVDDVGYKDQLLRQGWHPDVVDEMLSLVWQIPPYPDLTKLMVREIITPDEFIKWIGKIGFEPGWAAALYDAHFRLPGPAMIYDAFHRGLISEAELDKYLFWHDYQPTARKDILKSDLMIMRGLTKTLIPRVDLRRAWAQGAIGDAELQKRYGWLGYEEDAALMAAIQKAVALTPQRNQVRNMFLRALRKGVKTESDVRARLRKLQLPDPAVELLIEAENIRRDIGAVELGEEPRILGTSHITRAYKARLVDRAAAVEMLEAIGWDPSAADMLLMLSEPVPEKEDPLREVKTAAARLYREGFMSTVEFEGLLRGANFSDEDIERIRQAEDLRYRFDYIQDLQRAAIEAYRKDVYTDVQLEAYFWDIGMDPERARALVAKEIYKKLPKPRPAPA